MISDSDEQVKELITRLKDVELTKELMNSLDVLTTILELDSCTVKGG
jgi:hypothetical protein